MQIAESKKVMYAESKQILYAESKIECNALHREGKRRKVFKEYAECTEMRFFTMRVGRLYNIHIGGMIMHVKSM